MTKLSISHSRKDELFNADGERTKMIPNFLKKLLLSDEKMTVYFVLCAVLGTTSGVIGAFIVGYFENLGRR